MAHRGRRFYRTVGEHDGGLGVAPPHHASVAAEELHLTAFLQRRLGQHLRRQLDSLAADAGHHQLPFHYASSSYANCSIKSRRCTWLVEAVRGMASTIATRRGCL